jgi:hypothetical protein
MTYAQVSAGYIVNVIELDDPSILSLFYTNPLGGPNFDFVLRIDNLTFNGQPCVPQIGWSYLPPVYPNPDTYTSPDGTVVVNGNG